MIDGTTNCEFCLFVSFFAFFPELTHVEEALRGVGAGALKPHEGDEEGDGVGDPDEEDADPGQRHGHVQVRSLPALDLRRRPNVRVPIRLLPAIHRLDHQQKRKKKKDDRRKEKAE